MVGFGFLDYSNTWFAGGIALPDLIELSNQVVGFVSVESVLFDPASNDPDPNRIAFFDITNLEPVTTPVPLPAGAPLLLAGLSVLGWIKRGSRARMTSPSH